jgi:hypothetical protein
MATMIRTFQLVLLLALAAPLANAAEITDRKLKRQADFWTFKKPERPAIPTNNAANPVDAFVRAAWQKQNLDGSPPADRRTLARRIYFDLTGLPPTPEELQAFLNDKSPNAYESLVDRLLSSKRYGERWARYWLDIVHFGESHGYDKDKPRPNAWPYRDYVIQAANNDIPYSRFVQEQLAGDILFPDEPQGTIATGFIAAGPWDFVGHVELPESKTDGLIARYNDRDDMVMTTMSTFLSLTVHCARCHDHKFDPIRTEDYYRLQAVFAGVDRADRTVAADATTLERRKALEKEKAELEELVKKAVKAKGALIRQRNTTLGLGGTQLRMPTTQRLRDIETRMGAIEGEIPDCGNAYWGPLDRLEKVGYHSAIAKTQMDTKWVQLDFAEEITIDGIVLDPAYEVYGGHRGPAFGFPIRFKVEISNDPDFKTSNVIRDETSADFESPGILEVSAMADGKKAKHVRITATKLFNRTDDFIFALSEVRVISGKKNVAPAATVRALDSTEALPSWAKVNLNDNISHFSEAPTPPIVVKPSESTKDYLSWLRRVNRQERLIGEFRRLEREQIEALDELLPKETIDQRERAKKRIGEIELELKALPKDRMVYGATSQFKPNGNFKPATKPRPVHLLRRGDVKQPVREVEPGALMCLPDLETDLEVNENEGSRRAALAKWLTRKENFLLRRSIVNRVWQFHFGKGLVDSPNDFGHMGREPSHPELLDWLAYWFMDNGESLKALHKLIVTSAAYQQSSADNSDLAKIDSDNRYLWRMNRARLDAEQVRDTILYVSGQLDERMGGPSDQQFYFKDDHSPVYDYTRFDVDSPASRRRSIYRFIVRSVPDPLMDTLDCPDASLLTGKRNTTITALQALATLNNPFVLKQSEHLAARLQTERDTPKAQITRAFQLALSREPTKAEQTRFTTYASQHGLANTCRVLLNMSEFIFID